MRPIFISVRQINQPATAKLARRVRTKAGVSLRKVAKTMGVTAPFLSDLELGKRNWTPQRIEQFDSAIEAYLASYREAMRTGAKMPDGKKRKASK